MNSPNYSRVLLRKCSFMEMSSPFKNVSVAFNWLNRDYPIYHTHTHWELFLVLAGEVCHNINGHERMLKKGDVCIVRPKDRHSLTFAPGQEKKRYQNINFTFSDDYAKKMLHAYESYEALLAEEKPIQFSLDDMEMTQVYEKALLTQNLPRERYEMSTKLILLRIMTLFFEQQLWVDDTLPAWLNEFVLYLNMPGNFDKSTKELAASTPYSYSRLSTLFKQYMGVTIVDYINERKMNYAKRLLRTTTLTMLQIASQIGYNSLSSFNHLFKEKYNMTPTEYRKAKTN